MKTDGGFCQVSFISISDFCTRFLAVSPQEENLQNIQGEGVTVDVDMSPLGSSGSRHLGPVSGDTVIQQPSSRRGIPCPGKCSLLPHGAAHRLSPPKLLRLSAHTPQPPLSKTQHIRKVFPAPSNQGTQQRTLGFTPFPSDCSGIPGKPSGASTGSGTSQIS